MDEKIALLQQYIDESENIVFFGGAGVSTESGIPDFRSVDGLYHQQYKYPPEQIISHSFFMADPSEFYRFYKDKMLITDAERRSLAYRGRPAGPDVRPEPQPHQH